MLNTSCRNGFKRSRIACTACVLWIDGIEVGIWLCICIGGSSIGILLKIRCKTKCDKTPAEGRCTCKTRKTQGYFHICVLKIQCLKLLCTPLLWQGLNVKQFASIHLLVFANKDLNKTTFFITHNHQSSMNCCTLCWGKQTNKTDS